VGLSSTISYSFLLFLLLIHRMNNNCLFVFALLAISFLLQVSIREIAGTVAFISGLSFRFACSIHD